MNSHQPARTSVLVNTFNHARYLPRCLDSVLEQSRVPDEVIVYDDGSSDGSTDVVRGYGPRVRLLARPHGAGKPTTNQALAIAEAFRESTGDLVFLLDGDDAFLPGKVASYCEAFASESSIVMVQAPAQRIDLHGRSLGLEYYPRNHQDDPLASIYKDGYLNLHYPTSTLAFSRDYLHARLPLNTDDGLHLWPDGRLAVIAPLFGRVATLNQPWTQWRRHGEAHTIQAPMEQYRLVRDNQLYFNAYCRSTKRRQIHPWRTPQLWRLWVSHYLLPRSRPAWFRALRWTMMTRKEKEWMTPGA